MKGKIQVIEGIYPVTTLEAVKVGDGTNKTLKDMIDNNEFGGAVTSTTSGRGMCQIELRGCKVVIKEVMENLSTVRRVSYTFPNIDSDRGRRMYVFTPSGGNKTIDIPDGELGLNDALIYNFDSNTLEVRNTSWGNVKVSNNEVLLLYHSYSGVVCGELAKYIVDYNQSCIPIKELDFDVCSDDGNGLSQGMFIIDDYMYCWGHSSDDRVTTLGGFRKYSMDNLNTVVHSGNHNLGHMNAPSYCHARDMMCVSNGSKLYDQTSLPMEGWIFPNFKSILESNPSNLVFDELPKITLDFSQFVGEFKAQICWGSPSTDFIYLMTCDNRIVRKLLLGKTNGEYDGTYQVVNTWRTTKSDIVGGFKFYNGHLWVGVKGDEYCLRKMKLCTNEFIENEYILINNKYGVMQSIDIKDGIFYAYTDGKGYKIDAINL